MDTIKKNIYYLNIGELSTFCERHNIPYIISISDYDKLRALLK